MARARRRPTASATAVARSGGKDRRRVEALLAGENLDTSGLDYDFDGLHLALAGTGSGALAEVERRIVMADLASLVLEEEDGRFWAWAGTGGGLELLEVEGIWSGPLPAGTRLAIGEAAPGLAGWRITHHQARAALSMTQAAQGRAVRYRDVALLATTLKDDLLADSLKRMYLEPLDEGGDRGEELRDTLRAYFAAGRKLSLAGASIGVTRQAVARRLRSVEDAIGCPIASCGPELELALRLAAFEAERSPMRPVAPAG